MSKRKVGNFLFSFSGFKYKRKVASKPAKMTLSQRNARLRGCACNCSIHSFLPTIMPACTLPSNLSPEKETKSTPCVTFSCTVGSFGKPYWLKSTNAPLPKSVTTGTFISRPSSASSFSETEEVKPQI